MLTTGATEVNGATPPRAVMLSVADLAARDGVSKAAVSRRVKQLRERGLQVELDGQGRVALVHSVQYDDLKARIEDPSKRQAPVLPSPIATGETYDEALRQKTWTEAERARLRLLEEQGKLIRVDLLADALAQAGEKIVRSVDLILNDVDDLAAAVAKEGTSGLRAALKKVAFRLKSEMADALSSIAAEAPEHEPDEQP
jgi:DNA-binding Lrp family transcriptional regulator